MLMTAVRSANQEIRSPLKRKESRASNNMSNMSIEHSCACGLQIAPADICCLANWTFNRRTKQHVDENDEQTGDQSSSVDCGLELSIIE